MGNLGSYQTMVTLAKKVGGPGRLALIIAASGGLLGYGVKPGCEAVWRRVRPSHQVKGGGLQECQEHLTVTSDADCGAGLSLHVGDEIRVLERDGDALLVKIVGNNDNPHVVSAEVLRRASDFDESLSPDDR